MVFAPKTALGGEEDAPNAGRSVVLEDAPNAGRPVVLCEGPLSVEIAGVPKVGRVVVEDE